MGKRNSSGSADDSADTVQSLPTTNGSQLALFPWLRELAGNSDCFEADEAYFLNTGTWVNNAGKAVFYTPQHAVLTRAGFISQEKFGIYKPPPTYHPLMATSSFTAKSWLKWRLEHPFQTRRQ